MNEELCVDVTMEDITTGKPGDPWSCAIAQACLRIPDVEKACVDSDKVEIYFKHGDLEPDRLLVYEMSKDGEDFIEEYDNLELVDWDGNEIPFDEAMISCDVDVDIVKPRRFCFQPKIEEDDEE